MILLHLLSQASTATDEVTKIGGWFASGVGAAYVAYHQFTRLQDRRKAKSAGSDNGNGRYAEPPKPCIMTRDALTSIAETAKVNGNKIDGLSLDVKALTLALAPVAELVEQIKIERKALQLIRDGDMTGQSQRE